MPIRVGTLQDSTTPMQVGMPHSLSLLPPTSSPTQQTTPMQVASPGQTMTGMRISAQAMPTHSSQEASGLMSAAEDELLKGATLPCLPWWEASLLNMTPVEMLENHWKMMDALKCLDNYGLQFICEAAQALSREQTSVRAPPSYPMLQPPDALLAHEFYRAANNLSTARVMPLPTSTQWPPAEAPVCHCNPEIEAAVINMERHEEASRVDNPRLGSGLSRPLQIHQLSNWQPSAYLRKIHRRPNRRPRPSSSRMH